MSEPSGERESLRALYGDALALFRQDAASAELLAAIPASGWNRSGGMAFASALLECLGGTLMSIGWYALLADHVVLNLDGMYLDAEGAYTVTEVLDKYSSLARIPLAMWPLTDATVTPPAGTAQQRAALVARLAVYLPKLVASPKPEPAVGIERRRRSRKAATPQNSKAARV